MVKFSDAYRNPMIKNKTNMSELGVETSVKLV